MPDPSASPDLLPPASRHVAPGGWRRGVVGLAVGSALGLLLTRLLPRDPQDPWVEG